MKQSKPLAGLVLAAFLAMGAATVGAPMAAADEVGYLVNVTMRPGYNLGSADQALAYGRGICDKVAGGEGYAQLTGDIKTDINTADEYQATYLIGQAAQELCPNLIWQLRNSAAGYQPPA